MSSKAIGLHKDFIESLKTEQADKDITVTIKSSKSNPTGHDEYERTYLVKGKDIDSIKAVTNYDFVKDIDFIIEKDDSVTTKYCFEHQPFCSFCYTINYRLGDWTNS